MFSDHTLVLWSTQAQVAPVFIERFIILPPEEFRSRVVDRPELPCHSHNHVSRTFYNRRFFGCWSMVSKKRAFSISQQKRNIYRNNWGTQAFLLTKKNAMMLMVLDFYSTMPPQAYMYVIPLRLYKEMGLRRYGFHGTSYEFLLHQGVGLLGKPRDEINVIAFHLGAGASMAAIKEAAPRKACKYFGEAGKR